MLYRSLENVLLLFVAATVGMQAGQLLGMAQKHAWGMCGATTFEISSDLYRVTYDHEQPWCQNQYKIFLPDGREVH